jgi:hypothetical protein
LIVLQLAERPASITRTIRRIRDASLTIQTPQTDLCHRVARPECSVKSNIASRKRRNRKRRTEEGRSKMHGMWRTRPQEAKHTNSGSSAHHQPNLRLHEDFARGRGREHSGNKTRGWLDPRAGGCITSSSVWPCSCSLLSAWPQALSPYPIRIHIDCTPFLHLSKGRPHPGDSLSIFYR